MGDKGERLGYCVYKVEVKLLELVLMGCMGRWEKGRILMGEEVDGDAINWNKEHMTKKKLSQILTFYFF